MAFAYWILNVLYIVWNIHEGLDTGEVILFLIPIVVYQLTDTLRQILKELKKK